MTQHTLIIGDNKQILPTLPTETYQLIYTDPPYNTGKTQTRGQYNYPDNYENYTKHIKPILQQTHRLLTPTGTLYLHLDYREAHYTKILLDQIYGRQNFLNEIIWAYDYGGKPKNRWPAKHDTILVYTKNHKNYYYNSEEVEREPYMAPGLVTPEKALKGKLPTDVWWHTIVPTNSKEKTGYPTQKPEGILRRIITASTKPGDHILDPHAGSGTTSAVAQQLGRHSTTIDNNPQTIQVIKKRISGVEIRKFEEKGE